MEKKGDSTNSQSSKQADYEEEKHDHQDGKSAYSEQENRDRERTAFLKSPRTNRFLSSANLSDQDDQASSHERPPLSGRSQRRRRSSSSRQER